MRPLRGFARARPVKADQILSEETVDGGTVELVECTRPDYLNTVWGLAKYGPRTGATTGGVASLERP